VLGAEEEEAVEAGIVVFEEMLQRDVEWDERQVFFCCCWALVGAESSSELRRLWD
jgi:hypothetical protein